MGSIEAKLYDYQRTAAEFIKQTNRCGLFLDMGLGKAVDDESIIHTPDGKTTIGKIKVGDYLYNRKGVATKVLAVYKHENKKAYRVTLQDNRSFICCDEHLIPYYDNDGILQNKPLREMVHDYRTNKQGQNIYTYNIPKNEPIEFKENSHIIHPYILGVLIGNGSLRKKTFTISTTNQDIVYKIADILDLDDENISSSDFSCDWSFIYHTTTDNIRQELKRIGLANKKKSEKFIPENYLYDSVKNRMDLIMGVLDAKGWVEISKAGDMNYAVKFVNNEHLTKQIKELCLSLGFGVCDKPYRYKGKVKTNTLRIYTPKTITSTEKHENALALCEYTSTKHKMTPITDIQEVAPRNMTCFTVDDSESLYLINDYIVTHNTLITLTALVELAQQNKLYGHTLIIAPKRIAMITWVDEIHKWSITQNARYVVLAGLAKKKRDLLLDEIESSPPTIYIINREIVAKLIDRFPGKSFPFLNVIIDEAQSFKSPSSVGFKKLKTIAPYTHRWIELTGTPSPNGLMDIWALIYLIDGGARLGRNITAYRENNFHPGRRTPEGYPYEWFIMDGREEYIHGAVKDVAISMKKEDYLTMPGITYNTISLTMSKAERKIYNQLKKDMVLPLIDGGTIEASNAAVLSGALLQLANGAIYKDESKTEVIELHRHKLNALEEIVDGANGQPILCFYWFKHDVHRLTKKFKIGEMFTGTKEQLDRWNNKEIPLLFAQPQSAGHGLNFQHGGHILVFFCVPNILELFQQSIARLYRNGQKDSVIVHYLRVEGTVEGDIIKSLENKDYTQNALMDAVKAELLNN